MAFKREVDINADIETNYNKFSQLQKLQHETVNKQTLGKKIVTLTGSRSEI